MQLSIAQLQYDIAERQQALLVIKDEKDACQQQVDISRREYQRFKRYMKREYPGNDESDDGSEICSDDYASDETTSRGMYIASSF